MADIVLTIPDGPKAIATINAFNKIKTKNLELIDLQILEAQDAGNQDLVDRLNQLRNQVEQINLVPFLFKMMKHGAELTIRSIMRDLEALRARRTLRANEQSGVNDVLGDINGI